MEAAPNYPTKIHPIAEFQNNLQGDCGLTGRKIIVDTYGDSCPHGGGAFSSKDPTNPRRIYIRL